MLKTIKYHKVKNLKIETFKEMVKVVMKHHYNNKAKSGRNKSLSANDEILM